MGKQINLAEHQKIMLDIISVFADFCDMNKLDYFLDAGTLLGAVRHHGFIPWDNDADVCMTKPVFDKFIQIMEKTNYMLNDYLKVEKPEDSIHAFYKICDTRTVLIEYPDGVNPFKYHVYIDLFVKVGLPNNEKKARRVCKKAERLGLWHWFYKRTIYKWADSKNIIKKLIGKFEISIVKNKNRAHLKQKKLIEKISTKYPYDTCNYVTTLTNGEYYRRCNREFFDSYIFLDFNGKRFKCPAGYDGWLKVLYGDDYIQLPPKDKQKTHNAEVYWR